MARGVGTSEFWGTAIYIIGLTVITGMAINKGVDLSQLTWPVVSSGTVMGAYSIGRSMTKRGS